MTYLQDALKHQGIVLSLAMLLFVLSSHVALLSLPAAMLVAFLIIGKFQKISYIVGACCVPSVVATLATGQWVCIGSLECICMTLMALIYSYTRRWVRCIEYVSVLYFIMACILYTYKVGVIERLLHELGIGISPDKFIAMAVIKFEIMSCIFLFYTARYVAYWYHVKASFYKGFDHPYVTLAYAFFSCIVCLVLVYIRYPLSLACILCVPYVYTGHVYIRYYVMRILPVSWKSNQKNILYYTVLFFLTLKDVFFVSGVIIYMFMGMYRSIKYYQIPRKTS